MASYEPGRTCRKFLLHRIISSTLCFLHTNRDISHFTLVYGTKRFSQTYPIKIYTSLSITSYKKKKGGANFKIKNGMRRGNPYLLDNQIRSFCLYSAQSHQVPNPAMIYPLSPLFFRQYENLVKFTNKKL